MLDDIATKWGNISRSVWGFITQAACKTANINRLYIACKLEELESRQLMSVSLTTSVVGPNSVALNWTNNTPATGYFVLRATDSTHFTTLAKVARADAVSYTDTTALSGHAYQYEVEPYVVAAIGAPSNLATASTPLAAPTALHGTAGPGNVTLGWTNKEPLAQGFYLLRSTDGGSFNQIAQISNPKTVVFNDTTVTSDHSYSYEVEAYSGGNTSAASNTLTGTTPLAAPTGFSGTAASFTSIQLNWTDNDSNATGYHILRSSDGVHFNALTDLNTFDANSYTDNTVVSGHGYTYEVQAFATGDTSAIVKSALVNTPLAAPSGLTNTVKGPTSVQLNWTNNDLNATGYLVLRATDGTHFTQVGKVTSGSAVTFTDIAAQSAHTYQYEIEAISGTITSPASNVVTASTPMAAPATLVATATGPLGVKLVWANKEPLASGFYIYRSDDGGQTFNQIAQISNPKTLTYTDGTVSSDQSYSYRVKAYIGGSTSDSSNTSTVTTPLIAADGVTAVTQSYTSIQLNWTDHDSNAAGYNVLRSTNGTTFTQFANLNSSDANSYTDNSVISGHTYYYKIQGYNGSVTSSMTAVAYASTPLAAPSGLSTHLNGPTSVQLNWTDHDVNATGYIILRSTDGVTFTQLAKLTTASATTYADTTALSGHVYHYKVEACAGSIVSPATDAADATTTLVAPSTVVAAAIGTSVKLTWLKSDANATGYNVFSSSDGITYTQIGQVTSGTTLTYVDSTTTAGQKVYYKIQSFNLVAASALSTAAVITLPMGQAGGVAITMRYGNELVVTATGLTDSISITESGSTLTIVGDGQTFTETATAGGLFVYTRGGSDSVNIDSSVTSATTVDAIDGTATVINNSDSTANIWMDSTDIFTGDGTLRRVASFEGGTSKALGASLANPKDGGATTVVNASLWGTGPLQGDINQGAAGDCYFLSTLAAFADYRPQTLMSSAVDLGDGTYAVQYIVSGAPTYVRVSNAFPSGGFNGLKYDHPGSDGDIWGMVMEKAFCEFRTGANTYASINSGWMGSVYTNLGVNSNFIVPSSYSQGALDTLLTNALAANDPVTFGTGGSAPNLVSGHAYTLVGITNVGGVDEYIVRNPWGVSGDSLENSQGLATLTYAQLTANFIEACVAI